jgi:hypothetical protein
MPAVRPPERPVTDPDTVTLSAGSALYRIHRVPHPATAFNPVPSHRYFGGGRFAATADDYYEYLYAGDTILGAVAETLLRDSPIDEHGTITAPRIAITARKLAAIETTVNLEIVDLTGLEQLRKASQDTWLVHADPPEYPRTRHWAHWIRGRSTAAAGFVWLSKRDPTKRSYILFGDRCPTDALTDVSATLLTPDAQQPFDDPLGHANLRALLAQLNADVDDL